jgi:hypothetical protein
MAKMSAAWLAGNISSSGIRNEKAKWRKYGIEASSSESERRKTASQLGGEKQQSMAKINGSGEA